MKSLASEAVLAETRARLLRLRAEDRALWGKMTAAQMAKHLACAFEVALGDRTVAAVKTGPPWLVKFVALRSGLRWPKNLETTPELKQAVAEDTGEEMTERLRVVVAKMEAVASGRRWSPMHPFFGAMTAGDWMRWGYLHTDHHLRQFGR